MTIDAPLDMRPAAVPAAPVNGLLASPILPTLLKLALPNAIAMVGTTLASVVRGTGDMRIPSVTLIGTALVQIAVGGTLGLGLFGLPKFGMGGVAAGQLTAFTLGAVFLAWYLLSGRSRLTLNFKGFAFQRA